MPPTHAFEHLPLVLRTEGPARFPQAPQAEDTITANNKTNRAAHSSTLTGNANNVTDFWKTERDTRVQDGLPQIDAGIPLLLKTDTSLDLDLLRSQFEFEIVSEQEDGFVIVASEDTDLTHFQQKLADFTSEITGSANVAKIHEIREDLAQEERLQLILTPTLFEEWPNIANDDLYIVDISIACIGNWEVPNKPKRNPRWKDETWARKENEWSNNRLNAYEKWDQLKDQRLETLREIFVHYNAEILMDADDGDAEALSLPDSFTLRLKIPGKGLKDVVLNYPYIFEVTEPDEIEIPQRHTRDLRDIQDVLDVQAPADDSPKVCVIDSGIQEEHVWLEPGIDKESSHCFLPEVSDSDVADYVHPGGHGTRIAGAVLHGEEIPKSGTVQLECWVQNARVLDNDCKMPEDLLPAAALRDVVRHYHLRDDRTRIFNHSINADAPCRTRHMSTWAAQLDLLCHEHDVLIVQSSGNLSFSRPAPLPGIAEQIALGRIYPAYLHQATCRLANPGQSLQALTVGSVAYGAFEDQEWRSFANDEGKPSAFSRSGPGIWESIKPEVVEYGGDCLVSGSTVDTPMFGRECYPELVRSTIHGGPAHDRDEVGTSYAAPKVTRIAARLQSVLPENSCLLYRALIVQSAQWPTWAESLSREDMVKALAYLGYGIPDIERATTNTDYRTTFITQDERAIGPGECHIYQVPIPAELRAPGDDFDVRIDITLSYSAAPRRTRMTPRGYLAIWVDWITNRKGESLEAFLTRALKSDDDRIDEGNAIRWTIGGQTNHGIIPAVKRSVGTVQKDWAVVKSNSLSDEFCIAVRGHQGWNRDADTKARYTLAVTFEIVGQEIPIYEPLLQAVIDLQAEVEEEVEVEVEV